MIASWQLWYRCVLRLFGASTVFFVAKFSGPLLDLRQAAPRGGQRLNLEKEIGSFNVLELSREGGDVLDHRHVVDPKFCSI